MSIRTICLLLCLAFMATSVDMFLKCQNGAKASVGHCVCPQAFIGQACEIPARPLSAQPQQQSLGQKYRYFYFTPSEVNFYKLNFTICMKDNPSKIPTLFFVTTQKTNGSLASVPAFFQTFKLLLPENGCTNFSSHYISIKRREDNSFRKIIVGMKSFGVKDNTYYFNVFKAKNMSEDEEKAMLNKTVKEPQPQIISISMEYELYIQTSYYSSFIILITSLVLMAVFGIILNYIRKKYFQRQEEYTYTYDHSMRDLVRDVRRNNPEYYYQTKNDISVLDVFMAATEYGVQCKYFIPEELKTCLETPQEYPQNDSCSICLVQFDAEDKVRTTPCRHKYHKDCIDNWCEANLSCPICRRGLDFSRELRIIYLRHLRGELSL